jgi:hypothetical protein
MLLSNTKQARCRLKPSQPHETKPKPGRPKNKAVLRIMRKQKCSRATAFRRRKRSLEHHRTLRQKIIAATATAQHCPVIKSTNNWDFTRIVYPRLDPDETHGYLPGDLYANCLYYYANPGDLVVAPMAGSGMIQHVYEDRGLWTKGQPQPWEIDLRMFDLTPRGRYAALIGAHNILTGFPELGRPPDYVIADPPYLGLCRGQYSRRSEDIANMDEAGWTEAMRRFAQNCADVGAKRCTIIVPAFVDHAARHEVLCPEIVRDAWRDAGYQLPYLPCYASKHTQQHAAMARWNYLARETRIPASDIAEVLTFELS